ncbi:general transcription factor iie subunit 1 [Limosa lapponica baueri]|uniref:General transcription factor iie subunit 1 n=1 Tax=Limosa lapponica baueri TaxID=1758121 RepID=A0A2I0T3W5_LIMLA|nr:general transcription factor iie subunit 1 [Limosa lapponica baueri]
MYTQNLVIDVQSSEPKKKTRKKATKEQPVWMSESTVEGATTATSDSVGKQDLSNVVDLLNKLFPAQFYDLQL